MFSISKGIQAGRLAALIAAATVLSGCFEDDKNASFSLTSLFDRATAGTGTGTTSPGTPSSGNQAPTISGSAPSKVSVGQSYEFTPRVRDADGDPLSFSASGVPQWLSFDRRTGRLHGSPGETDVASYERIRISVSDGQATATLTIGSITVVQQSAGTAELSWDAPTMNADGSPLTDLTGYKIRYGTNPGALDQIVELQNPGITTYVLDNLGPATWYFTISAVNSQGIESQSTGLVWTTIG